MAKNIKLTYFKGKSKDHVGGKYYADGEFVSDTDYFYDVVDHVRSLQLTGNLPGLVPSVNGYQHFTILIQAEDFPPHIIHNTEDFYK